MKNKVLTIAAVIAAVLLLPGCSKSAATTTTTTTITTATVQTTLPTITTTATTTTVSAQLTVNTSSKAALGTFLVDGKGMTLYWTTRDAVGVSNITGTTLANWPVFQPSSIVVPADLNASDFGTITRTDGTKQTTYKGWPVYYYINDKAAGDTNGQGLANVWFAVNPAISAPVAPVTTTTTTTTSTAVTSTTTTTNPTTTTTTTNPPATTTTTSYSY
jgi:predicted lipoprotein with Yx(FWY)xxD motif